MIIADREIDREKLARLLGLINECIRDSGVLTKVKREIMGKDGYVSEYDTGEITVCFDFLNADLEQIVVKWLDGVGIIVSPR